MQASDRWHNKMKKANLRILAGAGVMLMIAIACLLYYCFNGHGFHLDRFDRLRVGMTENEVEGMMGAPSNRWKEGMHTFWVYRSRLTICKAFVMFGDDNKMTGTFHDH